MSEKATADDDAQTSIVDVRTTDLSEFDDNEAIRVHYRPDSSNPSKTVTGEITARYSDTRVMIGTDEGQRLIVDTTDIATDGGVRDFDTGEVLGRAMFAETAYTVETDGEDLKEELLGEKNE